MSEKLRVSRAQAIEAKCHDCQGHYDDGKLDCKNTFCSLYAFMPYRRLSPNLDWQMYSPRRIGQKTRIGTDKVKQDKNETKTRVNDSKGVPPAENFQAPVKSQKTVLPKNRMEVSP